MNKMKFESPDMTAQNIDRIAALFPNFTSAICKSINSNTDL